MPDLGFSTVGETGALFLNPPKWKGYWLKGRTGGMMNSSDGKMFT